jgi:DNA polymerase I
MPGMGNPQRLFLIDGTALAYRSFFAFLRDPLRNSQGMNTSAVYGFTRDLLRVLDEEQPERVAVIFDVGKKTFRHERFEDYKATRARMPDEMLDSLPWIDQVVDALALPRLGIEGWEADDIVATLARRGAEAGHDVYIVTSDKDFCQLVSDQVRIYNPWQGGSRGSGKGVTLLGPAEVEAKYGVPAERFLDYLALVGDSSDNVPGVPGVGPKRAAELITRWGDLDTVLREGPEHYERAKLRENLREFRDQALLSRELISLERDAPVELGVEELVQGEPDRPELGRLFAELEFREYLRRFSSTFNDDPHVHHRVALADLGGLVARLEACDEFVFDLETTSLQPNEAEIVGMAFSFSNAEAYYVAAEESMTAGGEFSLFSMDLSFEDALRQLKPLLEDPSRPKGGQNVKYDCRVLANHGIEVRGVAFDTLLESYLLDPQSRTHNLDDLALRYLGYRKIATKEVIGSGRKQRNMRDTPDEEIFPYASEDADITFRLHRRFQEQLRTQPRLLELYRDVELPLIEVLSKMERRGVKVDTDALAEVRQDFTTRLEAYETEVHALAGEAFNLNSPRQVGALLYDKLGLHTTAGVRPRRTTTGALSTDAATLEQLADHHPLPRKILEHRGLEKLLGTYVDALPKLVDPDSGRVHTSFNQAVAATGRLSSSDPNLQNIPIRSPEGRLIRSAFVAGEPDWILVSADYSQVELRILAHLSGDEGLLDAFRRDVDVHQATAARIFGIPLEQVTSELRSRAKAINFGIVYGMGAQRLARDTSLDVAEARKFIEEYFLVYPGIKGYLDGCVEKARKDGYVETVLGRRRPLPDMRASNRGVRANAERMAVNTPIQGSAADIIKVAMLRVDRRLEASGLQARMLLQVHDELLFETPADEADALEALAREEMESAHPLDVPLKVDVGRGRTWLDAH